MAQPMQAAPSTTIACVLAGGRSTRLGRPKAVEPLAGRPLIAYPIEALERAGLETVVVAKEDSPLPELDVPVWHERPGDAHPAVGIAAALRRAAGRPVLAVACDMPLLEPGLLRHLAGADERLVVPHAGGRMHPLCARYAPALVSRLEESMMAGLALHQAIAALRPVLVEEDELRRFGDPERMLLNVNTPEDLSNAAALLGVDG